MKLLGAVVIFAIIASIVPAGANGVRKRQAVQPQYVVQPPPREPLRQIPVVGTVVYGGLDYAGKLILSPTELVTGPRRY